MEQALVAWCHYWLDHHGVLTYAIIQAQASHLGDNLGIRNFLYSHGLCAKFCARHGVALRRRVGEAGSANRANIELAQNAVPMVLAVLGSQERDIFNADETGIVFGAQPCKTMAFERTGSVKKETDRISILLCCNATGEERLKPVIIAKPRRPTPRQCRAEDAHCSLAQC